jgi:hypothetical protein
MGFFNNLSGNGLIACITLVNAGKQTSLTFILFFFFFFSSFFFETDTDKASMSWFGYDQGVFSGVLISSDFKHWFPETKQANISGITSSCFSVC